MRYIIVMSLAFFLSSPAQAETDAQVRQRIINQSISSYSGKCPCPFNTMSNGRACGGRSAYSRAGGAQVLCYEQDVSDAAVAAYRKRHGIQ